MAAIKDQIGRVLGPDRGVGAGRQPRLDRRPPAARLPPRRRQARHGQPDGGPGVGAGPHGGRARHQLHGVHLHAPAGQRLPLAARAPGLRAADRRLRPVGQHPPGRRPDPSRHGGPPPTPSAGRCSPRADGTKLGKTTGASVWLSARAHLAVPVLPALDGHRRPPGRRVPGQVHPARPRRDRRGRGRARGRRRASGPASGGSPGRSPRSCTGPTRPPRPRRLPGSSSAGRSTTSTPPRFEAVAAEVPTAAVARIRFSDGLPISDLLVESVASASRSEARRLLKQGGVRVNGERAEPDARGDRHRPPPRPLPAASPGQGRLLAGRRDLIAGWRPS